MFLEAALRDLEHTDPRVRAQAADALGRIDDADRGAAVTALVRAVDDAHPSVRYAALLSLGELAAGEAVDAIAARLGDGEPLVREAATIALGQLGDAGGPRAWSALERALGADAPEVRFQAVASLAELDAARAASLVVGLLDDGDAKVRAQAAAALGDAGDRRHADRLARLLDDAGDVRHEAALALARLGDRRALPTLTLALTTADRALDAATALAALGLGDDAAARAAARARGRALLRRRAGQGARRRGAGPRRRRARPASTCARPRAAAATTCAGSPNPCYPSWAMPPRLIDSHCHLEPKDFVADGVDERPALLERARAAGVEAFVCVGSGSSLDEVRNAVAMAETHADVWAAVGIHPHDAARIPDGAYEEIERLAASHPRVVAVGETGLDYHYNHSPVGRAAGGAAPLHRHRATRPATVVAAHPRRPCRRRAHTKGRARGRGRRRHPLLHR